MIAVENLTKQFGLRKAVEDISFSVERGTVLGFLGPNGAGKTTTMRVLAGYLGPTSGTARVCDCDVAANPARAQTHIGYMPENTPLYDDMTVEEFLRFIAEIRGFRGRERVNKASAVIESCALEQVRHQVIDTLSKGYRRRTSFAQALLHNPPVLLLDEPTEGLDPNQKHVVREMIRNMSHDKVIMLSTHVLEEVEALCSRVIIISSGRLVADDTPSALKRRSSSYNALTLQVAAPGEDVEEGLKRVPDVAAVRVLENDNGHVRLELTPRDQQPLAATVLEAAKARGWLVTDMRTSGGRLDDVFRQITTTEDVA